MRRARQPCLAAVLATLLAASPAPNGSRAAASESGPTATGVVTAEVLFTGSGEQALAERVLAEVVGAEERIWLLAYTLSDEALLEALAARSAEAELDLRILVDAEQHRDTLRGARGRPVGNLLAALEAAGRLVPLDARGGRLHTKLMLVDDRTLLLGSKNWSNLSSQTQLDDMLFVDDASGALMIAGWQRFSALAGESFPAPRIAMAPRRRAPPRQQAVRAALFFAEPGAIGAAARGAALESIAAARRRARVCHFMITDPDIAEALRDRAAAGVDVQVVVDGTQLTNLSRRQDPASRRAYQALRALQSAGALRALAGGAQVHHKYAVLDDLVLLGSANWTRAAWNENHEVVLLLAPSRAREEPPHLSGYLEQAAAVWSRAGR